MSTGKQPLITLDTITEQVSATLEVRRSLFITYLAPVQNKESALQYLETLRKKHWDAAHHCYAWRLGHLGQDYRLADDGEPAGTAGKPILFVLQQGNFTNIIAVTVRYFGGVKLGKGPLARAYADSVRESVSMVTRLPVVDQENIVVHCLYDDVSRVIPLLEEVQAEFSTEYSDSVRFHVQIAKPKLEYLVTELTTRTNARAGYSKISTKGE